MSFCFFLEVRYLGAQLGLWFFFCFVWGFFRREKKQCCSNAFAPSNIFTIKHFDICWLASVCTRPRTGWVPVDRWNYHNFAFENIRFCLSTSVCLCESAYIHTDIHLRGKGVPFPSTRGQRCWFRYRFFVSKLEIEKRVFGWSLMLMSHEDVFLLSRRTTRLSQR